MVSYDHIVVWIAVGWVVVVSLGFMVVGVVTKPFFEGMWHGKKY